MALLALMDGDLRLSVRAGALTVERGGHAIQTVPTHAISEVHLYGAAEMSTAARNLLLGERIDTVFLTADGRYRGRLVAGAGRSGALRLAQYALCSDPARRLDVARAVVVGKLVNQRHHLARRQRRLQSGIVARAIEGLDASLGAARRSTDLDALRGHEGLAARAYFEGLGAAIRNPAFTFAGRSRRPPRDPVNACLSFGYTLLVIRVEHAVRATGLDASLGVLHEPNRAAPALALDLAEEARVLVDDLVLTLINRQQLQVDDFRNPPEDEVGPGMEGAVYMGKVGKTILTRAWERRIREVDTHPISHQGWPLMSLFQEQARQIARVARGEADTYVPLLWEAR